VIKIEKPRDLDDPAKFIGHQPALRKKLEQTSSIVATDLNSDELKVALQATLGKGWEALFQRCDTDCKDPLELDSEKIKSGPH